MTEARRSSRTAYHHGDLRRALLAAGVELARAGGPDKVVLREAARMVGVAPNSAYTHFATLFALKAEVAQEALRLMAEAVEAQLGQTVEPTDPRAAAEFHLAEAGRAYVRFAVEEPGLFRMAMSGNPAGIEVPGRGPIHGGGGFPTPDRILLDALARLVATGALPAEETDTAVMACWATVHGLAGILVDMPLELSAEAREAAVDSALRVLLLGLSQLSVKVGG